MPDYTPPAISAAAALAAAAAAEIVAEAARRNPLTSDFIVSGPTTTLNGRTTFTPFSTSSALNLTLTGAVTNIVMMIAGKRYAITGALVVALTDASDNFVYYDADTGALGTSVISPRWWYEAPSAPATGQHWFDMRTGLMKAYSGSAWVAVNRIFLGLWRADTTINATYCADVIGLTVEDRIDDGGNGTDGPLSTNNTNTTIDGLKNYSSVVQRGSSKFVHTANLLASAPIPRIQGYFLNLDTAGVALSGLGRAGGAGGTAAGGAPGTANSFGGAGGGGGGSAASAGAAGGGQQIPNYGGTTIAGGTAGTTVGGAGGAGAATRFPSSVGESSGGRGPIGQGQGGGGGAGNGSAGGAGGAGGGGMDIHAISVALAATCTFDSTGAVGTDSPAAARAAGGGGAGGRCRLRTKSLKDHNGSTFTAAGGAGGVGIDPGITAGHGGIGGAGVFEIKDI